MIKVIIELANDEIKRENEIKNAINDILDCYEIEHEIQTIKKEDYNEQEDYNSYSFRNHGNFNDIMLNRSFAFWQDIQYHRTKWHCIAR